MNSIYLYQPVVDDHTSHHVEITDEKGNNLVERLCTLNESVYVSINDETDVSSVTAELNFEQVELTSDLLRAIKKESPHAKLIKARREAMLNKHYSTEERLHITELASGVALNMIESTADIQQQLADYKSVVESCNAWRSDQYELLGLKLDL